ncbi:MAG: hypothetical protein P8Y71_08305 [Pseudolabrys sp.]
MQVMVFIADYSGEVGCSAFRVAQPPQAGKTGGVQQPLRLSCAGFPRSGMVSQALTAFRNDYSQFLK